MAISLADATDSELHLTYVGVLPRFLDNGPRGREYNRAVHEEIELESEKELRRLAWKTKVAGGTVAGTHLGLGGAAHEIVDLADELGAGLIIVGDRGHAKVRNLLVGSVSDSVVLYAHCPVLVVRAGEAMSSQKERNA